ncbi:MAG: hypothetical protein AAF098_14575 [Pseudomonadota bacterium]
MLLRRLAKHVEDQNWFAVGIDLAIVVIGVFIGIQVANWNDVRVERSIAATYVDGFERDLTADLEIIEVELAGRSAQLQNAKIVLEFYRGKELDVSEFFGAFYPALASRNMRPNRNTIDEVLNSGGLRIIEDSDLRSGLLELYSIYDQIADTEAHIARDFDVYLYDPTFESVPIDIFGPWEDNAQNRSSAESLLSSLTIENGFQLIVVNIEAADGLLYELTLAKEKARQLLKKVRQ